MLSPSTHMPHLHIFVYMWQYRLLGVWGTPPAASQGTTLLPWLPPLNGKLITQWGDCPRNQSELWELHSALLITGLSVPCPEQGTSYSPCQSNWSFNSGLLAPWHRPLGSFWLAWAALLSLYLSAPVPLVCLDSPGPKPAVQNAECNSNSLWPSNSPFIQA